MCLIPVLLMLFLTYKFNHLMWWYTGSKASVFRNLLCKFLTLYVTMVLLSLVSAFGGLIYRLTCDIGDF